MLLWVILLGHSHRALADAGSLHETFPATSPDEDIAPTHTTNPKRAEISPVCIVHTAIASDRKANKIDSFTTLGALNCWDYCKFMRKCTALTFNTMNGICTLYNDPNLEMEFKDHEQGDTMMIHILKTCVKYLNHNATTGPAMKMKDVLYLSKSANGVLIEQYSDCLSIDEDLDAGKDSYILTWQPCHVADSWIVKEVGLKGDLSLYQISLGSTRSQRCIDVEETGVDNIDTRLNKCKEVPSGDLNSQVMLISQGEFAEKSHDIRSVAYQNFTLFTDDDIYFHSLANIHFKDPNGHETSLCLISQLEIKNGKIVSEKGLNFFLPGSTITVKCNKGHIVQGLAFSTIQHIQCGKDVAAKPCMPAKERISRWKRKKAASRNGFLLVIIGSFLSVTLCSAIMFGVAWQKSLTKVNQLKSAMSKFEQSRFTLDGQFSECGTAEGST